MIVATADNFGLSFLLEIVGLVVVVWFVVRKFPGPLVVKMMNDKLAEIRGQLSAGEEAAAAAAALVADRKAALEAAGGEAVAIVEQARRGAELVANEGERQAEEEYERIVRRAGAAIEAARGSVRAEIMAQVGRLVVAAATDVVEAELDATAQHRLIGEAITATEAEVH
jgi:F-type H+-transporting ATPase subunit b